MSLSAEFSKKHKRPEGAVRCGTLVCFELDELMTESCTLEIRKDGEKETLRLPLVSDGGLYSARHRFEEAGLYFWSVTDEKRNYLHCSDRGEIYFSHEKAELQQTVYSAEYRKPKGFERTVAYQIFPDRFAVSGPIPHLEGRVYHENMEELPLWKDKEDGGLSCNDFFGGNLKGIKERLTYLAGLGVSLLYLNPIFLSPSNHRYDTSDYLTVDPQLGSEEDFTKLCTEAHKLGIKIILDGVFSHTGADSVYFNKYGSFTSLGAYQSTVSPYSSWYRFVKWPDEYNCWWNFDTLPEVEENDPSYTEFITGENGVIAKWMKLGADGFRLDVADELPDNFIEKISKAVKRENPEGLLIGEVWEDASCKEAYGERRKYFLGSELDGVMGYTFRRAIIDFIREGDGGLFRSRIDEITDHYPAEMLSCCLNLLGSHDTPRAITALAGESCEGKDRDWQAAHSVLEREDYLRGTEMYKLALALLCYLPGIPMIYYGDECGMQGYTDPFCRGFYKQENTLLIQYVKELINERNGLIPAEGIGIPEFFISEYRAIGFTAGTGENSICFLLNMKEEELECSLPDGRRMSVKPWSYKAFK